MFEATSTLRESEIHEGAYVHYHMMTITGYGLYGQAEYAETPVVTKLDAAEHYAVQYSRNDSPCRELGTPCVHDVYGNRESMESMSGSYFAEDAGMRLVAVDPSNQAVCDNWTTVNLDCWHDCLTVDFEAERKVDVDIMGETFTVER